MTEYQEDIWCALRRMYGLDFTYLETVQVSTAWRGIPWNGDVEIFAVHGHDKAVVAYAWALEEGAEDGQGTTYTAYLRTPPIVSPEAAVLTNLLERFL